MGFRVLQLSQELSARYFKRVLVLAKVVHTIPIVESCIKVPGSSRFPKGLCFLHVDTRRGGGVDCFCKRGAQTKFIPLAESGVSKRRPKAGDASVRF